MSETPTIHRCAEPGCRRLTFTARCPAHSTASDGDLLRALDEALDELSLARDRFEQAHERVRALEAQAGIEADR